MKYIEKGWLSYRGVVVPKDAPAVQLAETRQAFYAGASILFQVIMMTLDPDKEATDADLQRMTDIQLELGEFSHTLDQQLGEIGH